MGRPRLCVLISGAGTTLQNLIDRSADGSLEADIGLVISNRADAPGLARAAAAGVDNEVIPHRLFADPETYSHAVFGRIRDRGTDLVCMAGFLRLLPVPGDYANRVLNVHPSLLPAFGGRGMYGVGVHQAVIDYGVRVTGCTVHFVDNEYDHGPIIAQEAVRVQPDDTAETLAERVQAAERRIYPEAIGLAGSGRLTVRGRRVVFLL